jgi:hypothetical protein
MIDEILNAKTLADVIDVSDVDVQFRRLVKQIHPDVCSDPRANDAFTKLQMLRGNFVDGESFIDDAGSFKTNGSFVRFDGDKSALMQSLQWYRKLMGIRTDAAIFHKYLPKSVNDAEHILLRRGVPILKLPIPMPQEHVNWVLSRMLEFNVFLSTNGIVHGGLNPSSVFITPEDHGIQVISFYHTTKIGSRVQSISSKYRSWYPSDLFCDKIASTSTDLELAKRMAAYLLGDRSGHGAILKRTHNREFVDFLLTQHDDAVDAFKQYRKLLTKNFEKKFHVLDI